MNQHSIMFYAVLCIDDMYKNFKELTKENPDALMSKDGEYLEKPTGGWIEVENGFIGIGYHGNESGNWKEEWKQAKSGLGHIPSGGYG